MEFRQVFRSLAATRAALAPNCATLAPRFLSTSAVLRDAAAAKPEPRAPWQTPATRSPQSSSDRLRQSIKGNSSRPFNSVMPPRPPPPPPPVSSTAGKDDPNASPTVVPAYTPLLTERRNELFQSKEPKSVYGLMGYDMGLEDASHGLFSEGDFLSRHGKAAQVPEMRLRPSTGRMVRVQNKTDFAAGLRTLDRMCKVNRVKVDMFQQRFHERPGLKRKRLKSQRWTYRFKKAFQHSVQRVDELRRQGW